MMALSTWHSAQMIFGLPSWHMTQRLPFGTNPLRLGLLLWVFLNGYLVRTSTEFGRRSTEPSEIAISLEEEEIVAPDYNEISDDVSSEYSIDYRQLRRFLSQKDWQSADDETSMIVNTIINDSADCTNFDSFPLKDLQAIDNLWTKYSLGHYGATAQIIIKRKVEIKKTLAKKTFDIAQNYNLIGHPV